LLVKLFYSCLTIPCYFRFFVGNPGDYAWGREGLDAIVTQLLNQMDGSGPPPLSTDKIKQIPVAHITKAQIGKTACIPK
jgi:hypothetical protein